MTSVIHFVLILYLLQNCVITQEILDGSNKPSCQKYSAIKEYIDTQLWNKQNQLDTLLQKLDYQETIMSKQQKEIGDMRELLRKYEADLANQQNVLVEYEERLNLSMKGINVPKIGFTARYNYDHANIGPDGVMKFNYTETNYGNGYNRTTGKFTCNNSGLYIFSVTIISLSPSSADVRIVHNGRGVNLIMADGIYEAGSGIAVVQLDVGDQVWIRSFQRYSFYAHSFFSGALVST